VVRSARSTKDSSKKKGIQGPELSRKADRVAKKKKHRHKPGKLSKRQKRKMGNYSNTFLQSFGFAAG